MIETEPESKPIAERKREIPKDLLTMYMEDRADMSEMTNFHGLYMKLLSLIDVGKEMLPDRYKTLRDEASNLLMSDAVYPKTRHMDISGGHYRMGLSDNEMGIIIVRHEDLQLGIDEMQNQQAMRAIPKLKAMDDRIFKVLVKERIVIAKKPNLGDIVLKDFVEGFIKEMKEVENGK